ncbi:peptidylprolyl isomerase [soil metagenome]
MGVIMTIRNKFGYVLVGGIAVAIILFLLGDALSSSQGAFKPNSNDAGSVNGQPVNYNEFANRYDKNLNSYRLQNKVSEVSEEQMGIIREQTWNDIVRERILASEFEKLGFAVTDEEIHQMFFGANPHEVIKQNFSDPATGNFDPNVVKNYIDNLATDDANGTAAEKRLRWNTFEQFLIRDRLESKYTTLLKQTVYMPKWYNTAYTAFTKSSINVDYVLLPYASVTDEQIKVTDSDLKAYLKEHQKEFEQPEYLVLDYVVFNVIPSTADTTKASEDLDDMYNLFKDAKNDSTFVLRNSDTPYEGSYLTKDELKTALADTFFVIDTATYVGPFLENGKFTVAKLIDRKMLADSVEVAQVRFQAANQTEFDSIIKIADTLVKQINAGTLKFADVYTQYNTNLNDTAKGVIGWVKPGETSLVEPFVQNQVLYYRTQGQAVLYWDQTGLVQIVHVKTSNPTKTAVKVAFLSIPILPGKDTEKKYYDEANEFYNANNTPEKFNASGKSINTTPQIKKSDNVIGVLGSARELVKTGYNAKKGEVLAPQILEGKYVVALVKEISAGGEPSIDAVRSQLEVAVKKQKKAELLKTKIGTDNDLNSIANKNGATINSATNLNLNNNTVGNGPEPAVAGAALGLEAGQVSKPIVGREGVYVIKVTQKTPAPAAQEGAPNFEQQMMLFSLRGQVEGSFYPALEKTAKVVDERYKFY